jgi:hypothetical protein
MGNSAGSSGSSPGRLQVQLDRYGVSDGLHVGVREAAGLLDEAAFADRGDLVGHGLAMLFRDRDVAVLYDRFSKYLFTLMEDWERMLS